MNKALLLTAVTIVFMIASVSVYAEGYDINPGMWETTQETTISGVPPQMAAMMQKPPKVNRECVKDNKYDFSPKDKPKECSLNSTRHSDKKVSWDIKCSGKGGDSVGHGEVNFNGNTMSGWFEVNVQEGPTGPMKMREVFKGKRVGSC